MVIKEREKMVAERAANAEEKPIYFAMKMTDGFIDLPVDEKKHLVKKMITETRDSRKLSRDDLRNLMVKAKRNNNQDSH